MRLDIGPGSDSAFADKELNLGHWWGIMFELRLNSTKSKIFHCGGHTVIVLSYVIRHYMCIVILESCVEKILQIS